MKVKMNLKRKILPITLGLVISIGGSLGIANAMANNSDPVPVKANNATLLNNYVNLMSQQNQKEIETYKQMVNNMTPEQMQAMYNAWQQIQENGTVKNANDLYEQMIQMDLDIMQNITPDQREAMYNAWQQVQTNGVPMYQMMQNITPEQMLEMDKAWMEQWLNNTQNVTVKNANDLYQQMIEMDLQMMNNMTSEQRQVMYNTWQQAKANGVPMYQTMQNITPEQMLEMDKAWMEQHQTVRQPQKNINNTVNNNPQNIKRHHNNEYRGNHNRGMNNMGWNNWHR